MGDAKLWAAVGHKKGIYMCLFVNVAAGLEQINSRINKTNCKERNTCKVGWNGATYVVEGPTFEAPIDIDICAPKQRMF